MQSKTKIIISLLLLVFNVNSVCSQNFLEKASALGINDYFGIGYAGGGISCVDFNKDGFDDLTFGTESGRKISFYINNNGVDFTKVSLPIPDVSHQKQILWVDIDNDDDYDLFIASYLSPNKLYRNDGNNTFTDISITSGIDQASSNSFGAIFGDLNNDGYLDLYLSNRLVNHSTLYQNNGDNTFSDITVVSGLDTLTTLNFCAVFWDYDRDGDLDLYKINDKIYHNELYRNDGNFVFTDVSSTSGSDIIMDAMGGAVGDMNNDGLTDIYIPNSDRDINPTPDNVLLKNDHPNPFQNLQSSSGTDYSRWCWGASWIDADNDGWQDLYVSNAGTLVPDAKNIFYFNNGDETFTPQDSSNMQNDDNPSFSCSVFDFNIDGKMDIVVTNGDTINFSLWQNNIANANNFINIKLEGVTSNKDAVGSWIDVHAGSDVYTRFTHCGIGYLSQESLKNHVGIGSHGIIDSIIIKWPSGIIDKIINPSINQTLFAIEGNHQVGFSPPPIYVPTITNPIYSVAGNWMELLLESIRNDFARPTVHARNLFHSSTLMYDLWAAYQNISTPYFLGRTVNNYTCVYNGIPSSNSIHEDRQMAISFAMYRLLKHRFLNSPAQSTMFPQYDQYMNSLGYDINDLSLDYSNGNPAALGNYAAQEMINYGLQDGSNELNGYSNIHYQHVNDSLVMDFPGNPNLTDFNRWQPLTLELFIDQSGNQIPINTPDFLSPEWGSVSSFSLLPDKLKEYQKNGNSYKVFHDPGAPPILDTIAGSGNSKQYQWGFSLVSIWSSHLDSSDTTIWDISPNSIGNIPSYPVNYTDYPTFYNTLIGGDNSLGYNINPTTQQAYSPQMVKRADYARVLAEFWADGPDSETPPGHWYTLLNHVSNDTLFSKKYMGNGPVLDDLEWDVKSYFSLGGAMHDAAISAWGIKGWYDYIRPVSAIRGMAELGQSSNPSLPSYHPGGLLLVPGYIELVYSGDNLAGTNNEHVGKVKLFAWKGPDYISDPVLDEAGVDWILAENWWPYQRPSFVTPPFAGFISGHSTFSRAAAEVMTMLTGDPFFPGGVGEFTAKKNEFLVFEEGPSQDVVLQWATYKDASDQCSLSRIWGGIHPPADDIPGRLIGEQIGIDAFNLAKKYIDGSICINRDLTENRNPIPNTNYIGDNIFSNGIVKNPNVHFEAANCIQLNSGFEVKVGSQFIAETIGCQ